MNVVIDTSVWIAVLISKDGVNREIIRVALHGKIKPQMSLALFQEYESVMQREKIQQQTILTRQEQEELLAAFLSVCQYNEIFYLWRPNLKDKDDDFLIELAVASNSEYIITENSRDLQKGELLFGFEVLTPQQFLNRSII